MTKEDALSLIDFEISRFEASEKQFGWTTWALVASMASLLWLALDLIGQRPALWNGITAFLVMTLVMSVPFVQATLALVLWATAEEERRQKPRSATEANTFAGTRTWNSGTAYRSGHRSVTRSDGATHAWASLAETLATMSAQVIADASITVALDGKRLVASGIVADAELSTALRSAIDALAGAARGAHGG